MLESRFQAKVIRKIRRLLPNCVILKNDANYLQGVPDLLILWRDKWAMLEVKPDADAIPQPNQEYYVELLDGMSFAAFIYPENERDVLYDLQCALGVNRPARVSQR